MELQRTKFFYIRRRLFLFTLFILIFYWLLTFYYGMHSSQVRSFASLYYKLNPSFLRYLTPLKLIIFNFTLIFALFLSLIFQHFDALTEYDCNICFFLIREIELLFENNRLFIQFADHKTTTNLSISK